MANIGKSIKQFRIKNHMKQEDLAEKLYVSRQTISNYETGKSKPDIDMLVRIAEVLETDVNTLLYGDEIHSVNKRELGYALMKFLVIVILGIVLYLVNKRLWAIKEFLTGSDIEIHMSIAGYQLMRICFYPILNVLVGYYAMELLHLLFHREFSGWKYSETTHRTVGIVILLYNVLMLPYCIYLVSSSIDYYKWKTTVDGIGYWSSLFDFIPVWDDVAMDVIFFESDNQALFLLGFMILGIVFRITKVKRLKTDLGNLKQGT